MLSLTRHRFADIVLFWPELKKGIDTPLFDRCKRDLFRVFKIDLRVPLFGWNYLNARLNDLYIPGNSYDITSRALLEGPTSLEWYIDNDNCVEMATYIMSPLVAMAFRVNIDDIYIVEFNEATHYVVGLTPRGPFFDFQFGQHTELDPTSRAWKRNEFIDSDMFRGFVNHPIIAKHLVPKYTDLTPAVMDEMHAYCAAHPDDDP